MRFAIPGPARRMALIALLFALSSSQAAAEAPGRARVLLSGVYIHGFLEGVPTLDSAVRIVNLDPDQPASIAGFALTDRFTPRKQRKGKGRTDDLVAEDPTAGLFDDDELEAEKKPGRGRPKGDCTLTFPAGAIIPAGGEIWVAATAKGFRQVFGEAPAFEAIDSDPAVPELPPAKTFLWLNEGYGTVALLDERGVTVDYVAFMGPKQNMFGDDAFDDVPWRGGPVMLKEDTAYGWVGRVLGRARDELGRVLPDTDKALDWPVGFSRMELGMMPTHRVELAGQSRFVARRLEGVKAKVLATSAPDNNYAALIAAFDSARRELRVRVYEITNPKIAEALIKTKKRGVKVLVFLEGSPVGGISDQERWLVERMSRAGIPVHFLATPQGSRMKPRYRYDHSKYVLVDDRLAIIGTENYGRTGVPVIPTFGNRGWMVHIENPEFVRQLRAVWDHDYRLDMRDVLSVDASPTDAYGLPYRDGAFVPSDKIPSGSYPSPVKPVLSDGVMSLELVLSPDTSLNENSAIIGMINRAKTSLVLEQNSVLPFWGKKPKADDGKDDDRKRDDDDRDEARGPSLPLQAVIKAARRGVKVRVLLDGTWYNAEESDERDNDDTVRLLNELRTKEGLDVAAKVINLQSTHLEKIHAKGVIVDGQEVFVGSINWSENSFEGNREVGVIISDPKVAGYYGDLFARDWSQSRLYGAALTGAVEVREAPEAGAKVVAKKATRDRVDVVDERTKDGRPSWVEVSLGLGRTGWIPAEVVGTPEVTGVETRYVVGREVIVTDTVVGVRESDKVAQLQFTDPNLPQFVAVVFAKNGQAFVDAKLAPATLVGKTVRMKGRIKIYKVPELILDRPDQLEILP